MADVDSRLDAAVAFICGRQRVLPRCILVRTSHIHVDHALAQLLRKGVKVSSPPGRESNSRNCPPPSYVITGTNIRECFFNDLKKQHVFVLYGLGGAGKSQIAFRFVNECQTETQDPQYAT